MRDQYAGDVSDVMKFAFLRALTGEDRRLGIGWYYVPGHDGRPDGRHLEWREEPAWQHLDDALHAGLAGLGDRSIAALERAPIWPQGTLFHRDPVSQRGRQAWTETMLADLEAADLVFLDPDNGIGNQSTKHATLAELQLMRRKRRSVSFITFPGRSGSHPELLQKLHDDVRRYTGSNNLLTLRTCVSVPQSPGSNRVVPRFRWITVIDFDDTLVARAQLFAEALQAIPRVNATIAIAS
jgi:hypothetical protein